MRLYGECRNILRTLLIPLNLPCCRSGKELEPGKGCEEREKISGKCGGGGRRDEGERALWDAGEGAGLEEKGAGFDEIFLGGEGHFNGGIGGGSVVMWWVVLGGELRWEQLGWWRMEEDAKGWRDREGVQRGSAVVKLRPLLPPKVDENHNILQSLHDFNLTGYFNYNYIEHTSHPLLLHTETLRVGELSSPWKR